MPVYQSEAMQRKIASSLNSRARPAPSPRPQKRDAEESEELWHHRKIALWSSLGWMDDERARAWGSDVCVPPSELPALVGETKKDLDSCGLKYTILGHVGDGNFHAVLMFRNDEELEKVRDVVHRMVHRALLLDGTCTGEHGVGVGKKEYLAEELGEGTVELMRTIKRTIDPLNLFNPGKVRTASFLNMEDLWNPSIAVSGTGGSVAFAIERLRFFPRILDKYLWMSLWSTVFSNLQG
jgi:FAD/FMN-containing dehydrogenase